MRTIITALFLILFSQSAGAANVGFFYKVCKPFADNGFEIKSADDSICFSYFLGVNQSNFHACKNLKDIGNQITENENLPDKEKGYLTAYLLTIPYTSNLAHTDGDVDPLIQAFVNWAEKNPEKWKYSFLSLMDPLENFGCKIYE